MLPDLALWQWLLVELGLLTIAVVLARFVQPVSLEMRLVASLRRLAERPLLCFVTIFATAILLRLLLLTLEPVPIPLFHDEFSYLLGADTFFRGRLANPTPAVPLAFETIHTNMWPTYGSMYMPGPALVLFLGECLGKPWLGVLLITAAFCAALYWAVAAWLPRSYALLASALALAFAGSLQWWFDNYFCLGLSCLGTTLVLGSLPRIARHLNWRSTVPLACGLAILVLTRPYEGFCVAFPCVAVLLWHLRTTGLKTLTRLSAFPVALLALIGGWLLFINFRATGHPFLFPYMLNFRQYHITGAFLFSAPHPIPAYDNGMLRRFYPGAELPQYDFMRHHPLEFLAHKVTVYYANFLFGLGLVALAGLAYLWRHRREGLLLALPLAFAGFALNVLLMAWAPFPQYAAPAAPLLYFLAVYGIYALRRHPIAALGGIGFAPGLLLAEAMLIVSIFGWRISDNRDFPEPQYISKDRAHVAHEVLAHPGKQLCLVRYTRFHDGWQEWVFNGADLQNQQLLWARSLDPDTDRAVIAAYPGRTVWLVQPDNPDRLVRLIPKPSIPSGKEEVGSVDR